MTSQTSLESGLFHAYWDDGVLDLLCGAALLVAGIGWTALGAFSFIQMPLWITLWIPLHRSFVEPRAGYVRFSLARRTRNEHQLKLTLAVGVGALLCVLVATTWLARPAASLPNLIAGLPAVLLGIGLALGGLLTGATRFHAYAGLFVLGALATIATGAEPGAAIAVAGGLITLSAVVLMTRFVRASATYANESDG